MSIQGKKVAVVSLGCDKNRVEIEKCLGTLIFGGATLTYDFEDADIIILNTCAFLESAREEAIDHIFEIASLKKSRDFIFVVTGCLPKKYIKDLYDEIPEVDVFLGTYDYPSIIECIEKAEKGERVNGVKNKYPDFKKECRNRVLTSSDVAYLKIADGCENCCSYCTIPSIRGKFVSCDMDVLVEEVKNLAEIKELILVAQDVTRYGLDLCGERSLVKLIQRLTQLEGCPSIRLLYCYPEGITEELIQEIKNNDKVIKYMDIPFQHASDSVLKRMNRKGGYLRYSSLVKKLKKEIPSIAIRSTFMTGFPGETEEDVEILVKFLKKAKLFNVGFFAYSREEGTPSYSMPCQVDEEEKERRLEYLYSVQKEVWEKIAKGLIGHSLAVRIEGKEIIEKDGEEIEYYFGRSYLNAPDIDGRVLFTTSREVSIGESGLVKINSYENFDLYGKMDIKLYE